MLLLNIILFNILKKKIAEQPGKSHFIREGKIESKEKETYVDCD